MDEIQVYEVKGAWVDEPFVTFETAKMVLYDDHKRLVDKLQAKLVFINVLV
jgi:hypothetical protein